MSDLAVERYNAGGNQVGVTLFAWLRDRAEEVGDDEAYALQRRNAQAR